MRHVIRSEWTKFWSVRSTMWSLLILIVVTVGVSVLFSWGVASNIDDFTRRSAQLSIRPRWPLEGSGSASS